LMLAFGRGGGGRTARASKGYLPYASNALDAGAAPPRTKTNEMGLANLVGGGALHLIG